MTKASWDLLTKEQQRRFGNGCGPASFEEWVPDFHWNDICRKHDFYYRTYGNPLMKMYYDTVLLKDMIFNTFTSGLSWILFSPLMIPIALLYWFYCILGTPMYTYKAYKETGLVQRTMEVMKAIYIRPPKTGVRY